MLKSGDALTHMVSMDELIEAERAVGWDNIVELDVFSEHQANKDGKQHHLSGI